MKTLLSQAAMMALSLAMMKSSFAGEHTGGAIYIPKRTKLKRRLKTIKGRRK